jgi:hypothetical protein
MTVDDDHIPGVAAAPLDESANRGRFVFGGDDHCDVVSRLHWGSLGVRSMMAPRYASGPLS